MKKCAILIGVNNTHGLPPLSAAQDNAKKMNEWALSQGFITSLFTDENVPVRYDEILEAVDSYVKTYEYEQMVIYFSGHGYLAGPRQEVWTLSDAKSNPGQCIGLSQSIMYSRFTKIKNVVFISDACRTANTAINFLGNNGLSIFKTDNEEASLMKVDEFYASLPGKPSHEILTSSGTYESIYTECLLEGLNGVIPEIITTLSTGTEYRHVVLAYELNDYLENAVPKKLIELGLFQEQQPLGEITSRNPIFLSKITGYAPERTAHSYPPEKPDEDGSNFGLPKSFINKPEVRKEIDRNITDIMDSLSESDILPGMEANTGLKITGVLPEKIWTDGHEQEIAKQTSNSGIFFESSTDRSSTVLIQLEDGTGIPFTLIKGYHANAVFRDKRLININYIPSPFSYKRFDYVRLEQEIKKQKAEIIAAAQFGVFSPSEKKLSMFADYIRRYKAIDPTLGLFAAYAYALSGDFNEIRSVYDHMAREKEPVLFDVALLNKFTELNGKDVGLKRKKSNSSFMPLLTQGWSYMNLSNDDNLFELSTSLIPGLWTSFDEKGVKLLIALLKQKL